MKGHTKIYHVDGRITEHDHTSVPSLKFWQDAVGGCIELVPRWPNGVAFCNEEGKLHGLQHNPHAQKVWGIPTNVDYLVGDIIEITGDAAFMRAL
jgi:hypothetical protein